MKARIMDCKSVVLSQLSVRWYPCSHFVVKVVEVVKVVLVGS
jgi:hypothetical protein